MRILERFYEEKECLAENGILFGNGLLQLIQVDVAFDPSVTYQIRLGEKLDLRAKGGHAGFHSCLCSTMCRVVDSNANLEAIGGSGDYGSDGFVALVDFNSKSLIWVAYFDCSNPFETITFSNDLLIARSTMNHSWEFPLKHPESLVVRSR